MEFPQCLQCVQEQRQEPGTLVPLSDYGGSAPVHYKAWVCTNPVCDFNIKIRNGEVIRNEQVSAGGRSR